MRGWIVGPAFALVAAVAVGLGRAEEKGYESPYTVRFAHPLGELVGDLERGERGDPRAESDVPHAEWYARRVRERWGAWGPPARHYPAPEGAERRSAEWKRERVVAAALRFRGYGYQHHHVPDWDPPAGWPWKEVAAGRNGKGVDCSNFTAFAYNQALGIKPTGAVREQSEELVIPGPGRREVRAERVERPDTYSGLVATLRTGDLVYVRGKVGGEVTHVVMWVGPIGHSPDGVPLILDSHGQGVKDSTGATIPAGIHLRPFREDSWYYRCTSHAHRIIRGE